MPTYNLNVTQTTTFGSDGTATITFAPPSIEYWDLTSIAVQTSDPTDGVIIPEARITLDGIFKEGTFSGNFDASDTQYHIEKGQHFVCTWTGGTAGRTATFTLNGTRSLYS